jgi:hypothetical protein
LFRSIRRWGENQKTGVKILAVCDFLDLHLLDNCLTAVWIGCLASPDVAAPAQKVPDSWSKHR